MSEFVIFTVFIFSLVTINMLLFVTNERKMEERFDQKIYDKQKEIKFTIDALLIVYVLFVLILLIKGVM